jgi:molybdate transport system substrate-binding protein
MLGIGLPLLSPSYVVAQSNSTLLISAAASLKDLMEEIKLLYQQA